MERRKGRRTTSKTSKTPLTLMHASAYPGPIGVAYGVILDSTGHYKTDDSIDYVTKLKIIDPSLNVCKIAKKDNLESFVYVFIYTETVEEAPQIGRIGDIIRLENFEFDSYQRVAKAVYHRKKSSWKIFDGRRNANRTSIISSDKINREAELSEHKLLHQLRLWRERYFIDKSLYSMNWFKRAFPQNPNPETIYELVDVDIVVKLITEYSIRFKEFLYQKLVFADKFKNLYFAEKKGILTGLNKGDVMKLRSVTMNLHNNEYKISFATYSNFMVLQKDFKDAKEILENTKGVKYDVKKLKKQFFEEMHLDKRRKNRIGPNTLVYSSINEDNVPLNEDLINKNFTNSFPILKNFLYSLSDLNKKEEKKKSKKKEQLRGSSILLKYADLPITDLKTISKILTRPSSGEEEGELFRVRASIKTIENKDFNSNFKIYSKDKNKTWEIDTKKRKFDGDEKVIFYNVFGLKDESLSGRDVPLPAYLITYNDNPKYIYDLWGQLPDTLSINNWLQMNKADKERFQKSLNELKNPNKFYDLILQKVNADGNRVYLKLVDSIFWFTSSD